MPFHGALLGGLFEANEVPARGDTDDCRLYAASPAGGAAPTVRGDDVGSDGWDCGIFLGENYLTAVIATATKSLGVIKNGKQRELESAALLIRRSASPALGHVSERCCGLLIALADFLITLRGLPPIRGHGRLNPPLVRAARLQVQR